LAAISKRLNHAVDVASRNVLVKNGQVVPGLAELHLRVTERSDEIIDRILQLRRALFISSSDCIFGVLQEKPMYFRVSRTRPVSCFSENAFGE
jgi:hypothetical protein